MAMRFAKNTPEAIFDGGGTIDPWGGPLFDGGGGIDPY